MAGGDSFSMAFDDDTCSVSSSTLRSGGFFADSEAGEVVVDVLNLQPDTKYSVRVRCRNLVGWSPWSAKSEEHSTASSAERRTLPPIIDASQGANPGTASDWNQQGMPGGPLVVSCHVFACGALAGRWCLWR